MAAELTPLTRFLATYGGLKPAAGALALGLPIGYAAHDILKNKDKTPDEAAIEAGLGTGLGFGAKAGIENLIREAEDYVNMPEYKSSKEFKQLLQPGDVIFSRSGNKNWFSDLVNMAGGTPYGHAELYAGDGNIIHAPGEGPVVKERWTPSLRSGKTGGRNNYGAVLYRPDVSPEEASSAVKTAKDILKSKAQYKNEDEAAQWALDMFLGKGAKACSKSGSSVVCTDIPSKGYPQVFGEKALPASEMMKKMKPVAMLDTGLGAPTTRELIASRLGYPLLKGLKPGLIAGGATFLGASMLDRFMQKEKNQ